MGVCVCEYLGQRTDVDHIQIEPVNLFVDGTTQVETCPFMNSACSKIQQGYEPVCSVRKRTGELWITCKNRLCATLKNQELHPHQISMLHSIAETIYHPDRIDLNQIVVKREVPLKASSKANYNADYIMLRVGDRVGNVVEMQGGGETSGTGKITRHIIDWKQCSDRSNAMLREEINAGTIETNAWRRQQEQFIVKGNVATMSGGRIVFVVGAPLYDYLRSKLDWNQFRDLRAATWSLAIIGIKEDRTKEITSGPVPLVIDEGRLLFTSYNNFLMALVNQGYPSPGAFCGEFISLNGSRISVPSN